MGLHGLVCTPNVTKQSPQLIPGVIASHPKIATFQTTHDGLKTTSPMGTQWAYIELPSI